MGAVLAVEGTVQETAGRLHITATLVNTIDPSDKRRIDIESALRDFIGIEQGTLRSVAKLIGLRWPAEADQGLAKGNTNVQEAFDLYLQARGRQLHPDNAEDVDLAISLFKQAIDKDGSYGLAHAGLGESYWAKRALTVDQRWAEKARESLLRAIDRKADLAEVHVLLGRVYSGTGRPQDAVQEFQRALQLDPLSKDAYFRLGVAYEKLGGTNNAEACFRSLIELWPSFYQVYSDLGEFLARQGRYKEAEPVFRKVIELVPENSFGYQNLGVVYHYLGRSADANAATKKALAVNPTAGGYANLGVVYSREGHYSDAVPLMEKAVELDPNSSLYWGNLGDAYQRVPEMTARAAAAYLRAIKLVERRLETNLSDAALRGFLAEYYAKLPDRTRAVAEIAHARRLAPNNLTVLVKSALVYEITGRRDRAISALNLALQGGYSIEDVRDNPDFAELRKDVHFQRLDKTITALPPSPRP